MLKKGKICIDAIVKFRWLIALGIFILCLILRIHGSSIGVYNKFLPTQTNADKAKEYNICGDERMVRSDEWAVHTPTYFSQYYNNYQKYSTQMSVGKTNMVLDYYAPVKDATIIGKPISWGYILFGNEVGLSWYWCSLEIFLFMTAFEMFYILTKKNKLLSIAGMFIIGLSPAMQWWMVPHITIVFVYAMALFSLGYYFFTAKKKWFQWLITILAIIAVIGFVLSIFPSCQVICALIAIALLVGCLVRDKDDITFDKNGWIRIGVVAVAAGGVLGSFILTSWSDFQLLLNTVYPGQRVSVGGKDKLYDLFTNLSSVYLPYKDTNVWNNSEVATFIHFAPLFILMFPAISRKMKEKKDRNEIVGRIMWVILLVQIVFMCMGFSEILSKLTFFKYVNRMSLLYGWAAAIFTIWCIYALWSNKGVFRLWEKILYPLIYGFIYCTFITLEVRRYLPARYEILEIAMFVTIILLALFYYKKACVFLLTFVMCVAGATVNPINRGIAPITNHPISDFVSKTVKSDPDAEWITADGTFVVANFLMANGAKVLNGTNFLPDFKKWKLIDKKEKNSDIYNRYSNQRVIITNQKTSIKLTNPDAVELYLNPLDMEKLGIDYICTNQQDAGKVLKKSGIDNKKVFEEDGYIVYNVEY